MSSSYSVLNQKYNTLLALVLKGTGSGTQNLQSVLDEGSTATTDATFSTVDGNESTVIGGTGIVFSNDFGGVSPSTTTVIRNVLEMDYQDGTKKILIDPTQCSLDTFVSGVSTSNTTITSTGIFTNTIDTPPSTNLDIGDSAETISIKNDLILIGLDTLPVVPKDYVVIDEVWITTGVGGQATIDTFSAIPIHIAPSIAVEPSAVCSGVVIGNTTIPTEIDGNSFKLNIGGSFGTEGQVLVSGGSASTSWSNNLISKSIKSSIVYLPLQTNTLTLASFTTDGTTFGTTYSLANPSTANDVITINLPIPTAEIEGMTFTFRKLRGSINATSQNWNFQSTTLSSIYIGGGTSLTATGTPATTIFSNATVVRFIVFGYSGSYYWALC